VCLNNQDVICLENRFITIEFDADDGHIVTFRNNLRGLNLISTETLMDTDKVPWHLSIKSREHQSSQARSFSHNLFHERGATIAEMKWETDLGIIVEARIVLPENDPNVYFYVNVTNHGSEEIIDITYPFIAGIEYLGNTSRDDHLAYPLATGYLIHNPYGLFTANEGFKNRPYPKGFSGATMQFMAYYSNEDGGFYLATHDPYGTAKYLNFYKSSNNLYLICSFTHKAWDIHPGNSLIIGYPIVIGALFEGNWYEAAERYREWATRQFWCSKGPLWKRVEEGTAAKWLIEDVGFCTFGIGSNLHDVSRWLEAIHNIAGLPVFHVLGHDWAEGWTGVDPPDRSVKFNKTNIDAIKRNGDYFAPFGFDLFTRNVSARISPSRQFPYGCPVSSYMRNVHRKWNAHILNQSGADGRYYDIGASNAPIYCDNISHGHPIGAGRWMIEAYRELMNEAKQSMIKLKGQYIPQGTEVIHELFIDILDFYQMRAGAGPQTDMEGEFLLSWELNHNCEKIPLFGYVYHEYGPIAMDGFAKISEEFGDIFYWIAARVALWGDLLELNYEFSSLEMFLGMTGPSGYLKYHYQWAEDPNPPKADPKKLEFIREIAKARTDFAKNYLAYGRMTRPPKIETPIPETSLNYYHYNDIGGTDHFRIGRFEVPAIVTQAWLYKKAKLGILFVNLLEKPMNISFKIDPVSYGLSTEETYRYTYVARGTWKTLKRGGKVTLQIELPPRRVILIEVAKDAATYGSV